MIRVGRIPEATIDEIRSRLDIVDLIGRYVELKKAGRNFKALCPFHDEKTPSFNVNPDRQIFHCFGCDKGGNVFSFLMLHENLSFPEAARSLARECGIEIPEESEGGASGRTERLFAALEAAQCFYRKSFASPEGAGARAYLEGRGIDAKTAGEFGVGFAPERWDGAVRSLAAERISGEIGAQAGLLSERESGGHFDRLRGRLVFPIRDARGRVIAFGGRALAADQQPKYLNTAESPVYRKSEAFYGLSDALAAIRRAERAIVCEGYFDRLALHRVGLSEGLATCGTALTRQHARQLRRRTARVVLLFDGDEAGQKACERALEVLLPEGLRVRAAVLPRGEDPDDFLASEGPEALRALVDGAPDALDCVMQRALDQGCATPSEISDVVGHVAPLVALVADPVERSEYARRLAAASGARTDAVDSVVRAAGRGESAPRLASEPVVPRREPESLETRHLRQLARIVLCHPALATRHPRTTFETLLPDDSWKAVLLHLLDGACAGAGDAEGVAPTLDLHELGAQLDEKARALLHEIAVDDEPIHGELPVEQVFDDLVRWFDSRRRAAERRVVTRRMSEPAADQATLLSEKQRQLDQRRSALGIDSGTTP